MSKKEFSTQFLLQEFETLRELIQIQMTLGEKRINILITIVSANLALLIFLLKKKETDVNFIFISLIVFIFTVIISIMTFLRLIQRNIMINTYKKGLNRIRRYFLDNDSEIKDYLILPTTDNLPKLTINFYGLIGYIWVINSFLFSVIFILFIILTCGTNWQIIMQVGGILIFSLTFFYQQNYTKKVYQRHIVKDKTNFPINPLVSN